MEKVDQTLLDQIQYIYVAGKLPDELRDVYEKLPKKADGTPNMERKNKVCYTFVGQALANKKFVQVRQHMFSSDSTASPTKEQTRYGVPQQLDREEAKQANTTHTTKQSNEADINDSIEEIEELIAKTASLLSELKLRVKRYHTT